MGWPLIDQPCIASLLLFRLDFSPRGQFGYMVGLLPVYDPLLRGTIELESHARWGTAVENGELNQEIKLRLYGALFIQRHLTDSLRQFAVQPYGCRGLFIHAKNTVAHTAIKVKLNPFRPHHGPDSVHRLGKNE